ncbi:hypothetical protein Golax_014166 [Gossypium laxum]|uniref:SMP domain-containing protein n=1 Tax=Gossypium laxum TaxID=34288 RepID=A0A7J8ZTW2_9ROSI|nr:hypothetical protein [Gossypium laxum]
MTKPATTMPSAIAVPYVSSRRQRLEFQATSLPKAGLYVAGSTAHRTAAYVLKKHPAHLPQTPTIHFSSSNRITQIELPINGTMSQEQPQRPGASQEPIKYGDLFNVTGELASKPIGPKDAAAMQSAENKILGETPKGGAAAVMQSAAIANERAGVVSHNQADVAGDQGVAVIKSDADGDVMITEAVAGQIVGQYRQPDVSAVTTPAMLVDPGSITIGEALEAAAISAADKPIDQSDAAAIQAAEMRATGSSEITPGGIASEAQSAATRNARTQRFEDQATLSDVLSDATAMLPKDKAVTREDAERVVAAEVRNNPGMSTTPGGVGAAMAAAAKRNQNSTI